MKWECQRCLYFDDKTQKCDKNIHNKKYQRCSMYNEDVGKANILDRYSQNSKLFNKRWDRLEPYLISLRQLQEDITKLNKKE